MQPIGLQKRLGAPVCDPIGLQKRLGALGCTRSRCNSAPGRSRKRRPLVFHAPRRYRARAVESVEAPRRFDSRYRRAGKRLGASIRAQYPCPHNQPIQHQVHAIVTVAVLQRLHCPAVTAISHPRHAIHTSAPGHRACKRYSRVPRGAHCSRELTSPSNELQRHGARAPSSVMSSCRSTTRAAAASRQVCETTSIRFAAPRSSQGICRHRKQ